MCGRRESDGSWFFEVVRETTSRVLATKKHKKLRISRTYLSFVLLCGRKKTLRRRAHFTRSPLDRRRQLQDFAFTEYCYDERISRFKGGNTVVNLFVVFVAGETAE
jgi:hypothetical protein